MQMGHKNYNVFLIKNILTSINQII